MNTSVASLKRKEKTEQYLKTLGVPVNPHLPRVEDEIETRLRDAEEVARRAIALYILIAVAHGVGREEVIAWLKHEGLWDSVSPKEKDFIESDNPSEQDIIEASWRAESLWTLLWALGKIERLGLPDELCDIPLIQETMPALGSTCTPFINQASLRTPSEILDEADLIYRIDWAVVEARLKKQEMPCGFDPGIVYERHYALNWLTWYADEWDDITTDT